MGNNNALREEPLSYSLIMSPSPPKRVHTDSTNNSSEKRIMRISIEGNIGKFSIGVCLSSLIESQQNISVIPSCLIIHYSCHSFAS